MGFFKKKPPVEVVIPFDANWFDSWESLRLQQEARPTPVEISVSFGDELLGEIWNSIESHTPSLRILYDDKFSHLY
jgi:hypothetical protein